MTGDIMRLRPDRSGSLFLDREGVINRRPAGYVLSREEFHFLDGVPEAIGILSGIFGRIFVVTNQQGIGKGLMDEKALHEIDNSMREEIACAGGRIDDIFYCPHLASDNCRCRKPSPGMAHQAKERYPDISFQRSVMVGDTENDILFGRNSGMMTVFITTSTPDAPPSADLSFPSLVGFAKAVLRNINGA